MPYAVVADGLQAALDDDKTLEGVRTRAQRDTVTTWRPEPTDDQS